MKVLTDLHMSSNQIYNSGFETVKSLPTSDLFKGRIVFYEVDNLYYQYNGTEWIALSGSGGGGTTINGVGEDVSGKSYTIDGTSYTAEAGAEIFNDYTNNKAVGTNSHAEGAGTIAKGNFSHAEGGGTIAKGNFSHTEGAGTKADGVNAHAEGGGTTALGPQSHTEGNNTTASGLNSHAEGEGTTASGLNSHAEGGGTTALGPQSHTEGGGTKADGVNAHAEGNGTMASSDNQHVQGKFNIEDTTGKYAFIIGNGTSDSSRSNAFAIGWDGLIYINNATTGIDLVDLVTKVQALIDTSGT